MKRIIIPFFLFLIGLSAYAQYSYDYGFSLGASAFIGDIGSNSEEAQPFLLDAKLNQSRYAVGGFFRYNFTDKVAAKFNLNYVRIAGADSLAVSKTALGRNLNFRTDLIEVSVIGEYSLISIANLTRSSKQRIDLKTYLFGGVGTALFYPFAEAGGEFIQLRPLATEGVENAYGEFTLIFPVGAGVNFTFNKKVRFGFDIGYRFTTTDYLDDVSTDYAFLEELPSPASQAFANRSLAAYQAGRVLEEEVSIRNFDEGGLRGNPESNDGYLLAQFQLSYVIQKKSTFYKRKYHIDKY